MAVEEIAEVLDRYGLSSLTQWAWERYKAGYSVEQIIRDVYEKPEFKAVYPEYEQLAAKGRAYSVAELAAYRKQVVQLFRQYGLPESFYDTPEELAQFAANEISLAEINQRVQMAAEAAYQAPAEWRYELSRFYGVGPGDLTAYWLDPEKAQPLLQQRFASAQIAGQALRTGYGAVTREEAERLQSLGVTSEQAGQGFADLARGEELFTALDRGEDVIDREAQMRAAFEGGDTDVSRIERRRGRRLAQFQAGGTFATDAEGIAGVG